MIKIISNLLVIVFFSSCAAWRLQETHIVENYKGEIKRDKKMKTFISLEKVTHYLNGELVSEKKDGNEVMLNIIKQAYEEAGIFEIVKNKNESELQIELEVTNRGKSDMAMTVLTAMTLFLFPSKTTDEFSVKAKFYEGDNQLGEIERNETVTMYRQLFLIFAMPFKAPFNINNETLIDLNRSIVLEANDDGYFTTDSDHN